MTAPEFIRNWGTSFPPLNIIERPHGGISAARNAGIRVARGSLFVFVDADCILQPDCLTALYDALTNEPQHNCFQLHLVGHSTGIVGRTEELRLITLQDHLLQADGCIRYLNTAGFAIRRSRVYPESGLFAPVARRAEDTLLLANLMQSGELPFFVSGAHVQHAVSLSLLECVRKDIRSAYLERTTWKIIESLGVRIRVTNGERLKMLKSMWKTSARKDIGRRAWFVLAGRQLLRLFVLLIARALDLRAQEKSAPVDHQTGTAGKKCNASAQPGKPEPRNER